MLDAPKKSEKKAGSSSATAGPPTDFQQHLATLEAQGLVVRVDRPINKDTELHPLVRWQFAGGLPEDKRLYACPQTLFKFHPSFDPMLAAILARDPDGLLVLLEGATPEWVAKLTRRLRRAGIDTERQVRFLPAMPIDQYLSLCRIADVVLDPPVFGGGNSTYEALYQDAEAFFAGIDKLASAKSLSEAAQIQSELVRARGEVFVSRAKASTEYLGKLVADSAKTAQDNFAKVYSKTA